MAINWEFSWDYWPEHLYVPVTSAHGLSYSQHSDWFSRTRILEKSKEKLYNISAKGRVTQWHFHCIQSVRSESVRPAGAKGFMGGLLNLWTCFRSSYLWGQGSNLSFFEQWYFRGKVTYWVVNESLLNKWMKRKINVSVPQRIEAKNWEILALILIMYRCESWTIKKAECQRIDAFEL